MKNQIFIDLTKDGCEVSNQCDECNNKHHHKPPCPNPCPPYYRPKEVICPKPNPKPYCWITCPICKIFCKCCPPPICLNELPECKQRRNEISGDAFNAANGWQIGFINELQTFAQISDPLSPLSCEGTFGGGWHASPVAELEDPAVRNTLLVMFGMCPVVVWATNNGVPTLVKIIPGSNDPEIILPTPSLSCLAFTICINSGS